MADRYRLPEALGGGEYDEHRRPDGSMEAPVGNVAFLENGCLFTVALALLAKVEPPLPPEPPHGSIVRVSPGGGVFERGAGDVWFRREINSNLGYDWGHLCGEGAPVRLVPDPAAGVELPWRGNGNGATSWVAVGDWGDAESINPDLIPLLVASGGRLTTPVLTPATARAMAAALLAAADAAEAGAS
jgi:hypothetical protein